MRRSLASVLVFSLAGCGAAAGGEGGGRAPGTLELRWEWAREGRFRAPVRARLCAETGLVELLAVRGDSGVALVFFPGETGFLEAAMYPVFPPTETPEPRPGVLAALRWFGHDNIFAWYGTHGTVRMDAGRDRAAGTVDLVMVLHDGFDSLKVTGRFEDVRVEPAPPGCEAELRRDYR